MAFNCALWLLLFAAAFEYALGGAFPSLGGAGQVSDHLKLGQGQLRSKRASTLGDRQNCSEGDPWPATRVNTSSRLLQLRAVLLAQNYDAVIIPMDDAHQSEYVSKRDKRVEYISGFSGSAGVAVVTRTEAALWTDGRYYLQGDQQLDCNWIFMKAGVDAELVARWLASRFKGGETVAADSSLVSHDDWLEYHSGLAEQRIDLAESPMNLVDDIWERDPLNPRPALPLTPIHVLDIKFAGVSWQEKVAQVKQLLPEGVDAIVITALDEIAWLYNMRGEDVPYNPVFFGYAIIRKNDERVDLFVQNVVERFPNISSHLNTECDGACVNVVDYQAFFYNLAAIEGLVEGKVSVSPMSSQKVFSQVSEARRHVQPSIVRSLKGQKNPVEVEGMRRCHKRDSAAVVEFISGLERGVKDGEHWTEISAASHLQKIRSEKQYNRGLSFESISASGANGAIIHYFPRPETDTPITTRDMYLLDSGGQYLDGTTDVTRTFHFGVPTEKEKEAYTLVLLGSINLAMARWPYYTYGRTLDVLARSPLWKAGLNYYHGTGHGIGAYLNVHEGPSRINKGYRSKAYEEPIVPHMFFSDEPGYYEAGQFGVRLETIVMTQEVETKYHFGGNYMGFDVFTLVPFEPNLIDYSLFNKEQLAWLNDYHAKCQEEVGEKILKAEGRAEAYEWLSKRTQPVTSGAAALAGQAGLLAAGMAVLLQLAGRLEM